MTSTAISRLIPENVLRNAIQHEVASHAALLDRYGQSEVAALLYLFETVLVPEVQSTLARRLGSSPPGLATRQMKLALADMRRVIRDTIDSLGQDFVGTMREFAGNEAGFVAGIVSRFEASAKRADRILPASVMRSVVSTPVFDRKMDQWFRDIADDTVKRVERAVTRGVLLGEDTPTIIRNIAGQDGRHGVFAGARQQAATLARTAVTSVGNKARIDSFNAIGVEEYEWVSTLDSRTSAVCRSLDGQRFKVGQGPMPPAHPNCRSTITPIIPDEEFLGASGKPIRSSIQGPTDARTYEEWLRRQTPEYQDSILGQRKGAIFRRGVVPLSRFIHQRTLEPLGYREIEAIERRALRARQ